MRYHWDAPDDHGSAITGYRIKEELSDAEVRYDRTVMTHSLDGLLPGRQYRVKVQAKNLAGWSVYSDWSDTALATTLSSRPEFPSNLLAVDGSWNHIAIEGNIPYHNGAYINAAFVQKRVIDAYSKSAWDVPEIFRIPEDVAMVDTVDLEAQAQALQREIIQAKSGKSEDGTYNPFKRAREGRRYTSKGIDSVKLGADSEFAAERDKYKPEGSRVQMRFVNLLPDTIYEFRVAYRSASGLSEYSLPSRRAKTNRARLPGKSKPPGILSFTCTEVTLLLDLPSPGGEPITHLTVESKDTQKGFSREDRYEFKPPQRVNHEGVELTDRVMQKLTEKALTVTVKDLVPMTYYQLRAKAESVCGFGAYSEFTEPVKLPAMDGTGKVPTK
jgi:hypothetical protein